MDQVSTLRRYGLFDAKVPRYTSFPPANRFEPGVGGRCQKDWLGQISGDKPLSIYIHIPFCRRLCWFCACRTQGTQTLKPVEGYIQHLLTEIETIADQMIKTRPPMARLHLGGGTPTLLNAALMNELLAAIFERFEQSDDFEFSVEIDPTEASDEVLDALSHWGLNRASIGVQDFNTKVQEAIGRLQGFDITRTVIESLRSAGVQSLNIDLLYGLPFQTHKTLVDTLDQVISLRPDRLALYGYAHVPHVSKRQVMIPSDELPTPEQRFAMAQIAKDRLLSFGYEALGIDHFALPSDSLAQAAKAGTMRRNFQGYTDDPCETLLGLGASAISKFPQGYVQNAVSTSAYVQRIETSGFAAHKGYVLSPDDVFLAALVDAIMCDGQINFQRMSRQFPDHIWQLNRITDELLNTFPDLLALNGGALMVQEKYNAAARLIAAHMDTALNSSQIHSLAI